MVVSALGMRMWLGQSAQALCDRACSAAYLAYVTLRAWLKSLLCMSHARPQHEPRAYRVYVFNEGPQPGYYKEVPVTYFDPATWEADAREITKWSAFRMEVRYTFRHKKYRMVLRPGDPCPFPPYDEPAATSCRMPKGVLSARLQGPLGSDIDCDVTQRVMKYQGPKGDFHAGLGLKLKLQDMFPFDDQADNSARFSHLRIMDTTARLHDLSYTGNPELK